MVVWNINIKKADDIMKAVDNELKKEKINIDGVVEPFNDGNEKGMLLKVFDKYNPKLDICIWVYMPTDRIVDNEMKVVCGSQEDCLENNMWLEEKVTIKSFSNQKSRDLHDDVRNYVKDYIKSHIDLEYELKI